MCGDCLAMCSLAEQLLVEEGKDDDGGVDGDAKEEDEQAADAEVAVFEELEIDHWLVLAPGVPDEESKAGDEEEEGPAIQVAPNQSASWPLSRMI